MSQSLTLEQLEEIDRICRAFEEKLVAGEPARVEDHIEPSRADLSEPLLAGLLQLEMYYRGVAGKQVGLATYQGAIQLQHLLGKIENVLVANNTFLNTRPIRVWERRVHGKDIQIANNLSLASPEADWLVVDSGGDPVLEQGYRRGPEFARQWNIHHNFREGESPLKDHPQFAGWIPPGPTDVEQSKIKVLSRDNASADYLRLPTGSPLATGGAGGALPKYVGAISPDRSAWDWLATYKSLGKRKASAKRD